jgi:hypothetical protein
MTTGKIEKPAVPPRPTNSANNSSENLKLTISPQNTKTTIDINTKAKDLYVAARPIAQQTSSLSTTSSSDILNERKSLNSSGRQSQHQGKKGILNNIVNSVQGFFDIIQEYLFQRKQFQYDRRFQLLLTLFI